jgi:hypothetical protein
MSGQAPLLLLWRLCTGCLPWTFSYKTVPKMQQSESNQTPPGNLRQNTRPELLMVDTSSTSSRPGCGRQTLVTSAVALEAWKAFHSSDGEDGTRNPIGSHVFDSHRTRACRAASEGLVPISLRGQSTMVVNAANVWNACPELRKAVTFAEAKRAAKHLARGVPL